MNKKIRAIGAGLLAAVWLSLSVFSWFKKPVERSETERRKLAQMPELEMEAVEDGSFMTKFEAYSVDQFPFRDEFRSVKALFSYHALQQLDNNGYFLYDGYIVKQTYPLSQPSVNNAATVLNKVYDTYLAETDCKVYLSIVPDKGYYLADQLGYPALDYNTLLTQMRQKLPWAEYVDILDTLSLENYYRTDTHWKQETLIPTAQVLCQAMGTQTPDAGMFTRQMLDTEFYGVYYDHAAVPMKPDTLVLLQNDMLAGCRVYDPINGKMLPFYNMEKLNSHDMYEVYLSGNQPILQIENPQATSDRELIVFRDSFGSSITPLLLQGYKTVTLIDVRYISQKLIGEYVTFENQDVLFLYSTLVLNESSTMKR